jgi:hypothetical protein
MGIGFQTWTVDISIEPKYKINYFPRLPVGFAIKNNRRIPEME